MGQHFLVINSEIKIYSEKQRHFLSSYLCIKFVYFIRHLIHFIVILSVSLELLAYTLYTHSIKRWQKVCAAR